MLKKLTVVAALVLATACASNKTTTAVVVTPEEGDVIHVTDGTPVASGETMMHFETAIVPVEESTVNAPMMSSAQETTDTTETETRTRLKKD